MGFCFGGYIVNMLAASIPDELDAGVPYHGSPAAEAPRDRVRGPLMLHFGSLDKCIDDTWPGYESTLKANGTDYVAYVYEGAIHGFHNDSTTPYSPADAELSWSRAIEFFQEHLPEGQ